MKTKLTKQQIQIMKDDITVALAECLMREFGYSTSDAIDVLYHSKTFERLQDNDTGLYYQSPGYVYSFLQSELQQARC